MLVLKRVWKGYTMVPELSQIQTVCEIKTWIILHRSDESIGFQSRYLNVFIAVKCQIVVSFFPPPSLYVSALIKWCPKSCIINFSLKNQSNLMIISYGLYIFVGEKIRRRCTNFSEGKSTKRRSWTDQEAIGSCWRYSRIRVKLGGFRLCADEVVDGKRPVLYAVIQRCLKRISMSECFWSLAQWK